MSTDLAVIEAALKAAQAEVEGHRGIVIPGAAFQKVAANAPTWLAELIERVRVAEAAIERVCAVIDPWLYRGEFGYGPWQEGWGPDYDDEILNDAAMAVRRALDDTTSAPHAP